MVANSYPWIFLGFDLWDPQPGPHSFIHSMDEILMVILFLGGQIRVALSDIVCLLLAGKGRVVIN